MHFSCWETAFLCCRCETEWGRGLCPPKKKCSIHAVFRRHILALPLTETILNTESLDPRLKWHWLHYSTCLRLVLSTNWVYKWDGFDVLSKFGFQNSGSWTWEMNFENCETVNQSDFFRISRNSKENICALLPNWGNFE